VLPLHAQRPPVNTLGPSFLPYSPPSTSVLQQDRCGSHPQAACWESPDMRMGRYSPFPQLWHGIFAVEEEWLDHEAPAPPQLQCVFSRATAGWYNGGQVRNLMGSWMWGAGSGFSWGCFGWNGWARAEDHIRQVCLRSWQSQLTFLSDKLAARRRLPERELPADIRVILGARWKTARDNALCCNDEADFKYFT